MARPKYYDTSTLIKEKKEIKEANKKLLTELGLDMSSVIKKSYYETIDKLRKNPKIAEIYKNKYQKAKE